MIKLMIYKLKIFYEKQILIINVYFSSKISDF